MKGVFTLGIDVELAWGRVHRKKIDLPKLKRIAVNVREILDSVIGLLEKYSIPVTWNILGHLLLDHCTKNDSEGLPHPDMPRPNYTWLKDDWYRFDPCTNLQRDPAWYGKDIVDRIIKYVKESKASNEIGCHSFSHQLFGDYGCEEELARAEIQKCVELMKREYGIVPKVFAFPRDHVGHLNVLKEQGFIAFRDVPHKLYPCLKLERTISNYMKTYSSLFIQFLSYYFLFPPHVTTPREAISGLWAFPGCLAFGKKPSIPLKLVTFKAIQGTRKAIEEDRIFLMYTHLRDFGENEHMLSNFGEVLSYVDRKRREGKLEVKTMAELVNELLDVSKTKLGIQAIQKVKRTNR